eukprot:4039428-Heterocapsa_arctica.AAC.1
MEAPLVEVDYTTMTGHPDDCTVPVLVGIDRGLGYAVATVCRTKGAADATAIRSVNRFLTEAGLTGTIRL